ncbi:hypothetical protein ASF27_12160 [Methylobacterium sp. Leaf102]|uniref:Uncharacterized protein n=1 Tax=Methylobacterium bullatum TaxID=570505 RepID=A0A679JFB3_9HYPH|nr:MULTISPECIES: hypothetical protein [unclassified Methylobacterium]KQP18574.1 hypothetical protein ASF25_12035 [Methylobacterium sp. Leaf100]KQP23915.1 hypothetical protein ASF27_12160 [Methylobacterium sp. Leaf102]CAA2104571.1 hypothetical protein MBUL_02770 [Methylobacterium bullatum]GJE17198.1 hypothetical protein AIGOOFII_1911 [Methylobacterium marchantiae]GJD41868.1 hypothetical protein OICFNHDK_4352 [Methylobacterium bullatum]
MAQRNRYPGSRFDLTELGDRPLFHDWIIQPDNRSADGTVLTGTVYGHDKFPDGTGLTTSTVQAFDAAAGWAYCYSTGLVRLGRCQDPEGCANVDLM